MREAGPITTAAVVADSRSPSDSMAATRKTRPAALARIDRPRRQGPGSRGHQCVIPARAHARPALGSRVRHGREGIMPA